MAADEEETAIGLSGPKGVIANVFQGYDFAWVGSERPTEVTAQVQTAKTRAAYRGTPVPEYGSEERSAILDYPRSLIPYHYDRVHDANFQPSATAWDLAHEYGHLLGMADRYHQHGAGTIYDAGWKDSLMAKAARPSRNDVIELGRVTDIPIRDATAGATKRFSGPVGASTYRFADASSEARGDCPQGRGSVAIDGVVAKVKAEKRWR